MTALSNCALKGPSGTFVHSARTRPTLCSCHREKYWHAFRLATACPSQAGPGRRGPVGERGPALLDDPASRGTRGPNARASGCSGASHRIVFFLPLYMRGQLRPDKSRSELADPGRGTGEVASGADY